jgi:type IV secretion system protein TrbH
MNHLILLLTLTGLVGCATPNYGNLTSHAPEDLNVVMVSDAAQRLESLYPPAGTQFNLAQPIPSNDAFGGSLITNLRNKGYAVQEYQEKQSPTTDGLKLRYLIDAPRHQDLYRIKLMVGSDILTRAYLVDANHTLVPAGAWARMEDQ